MTPYQRHLTYMRGWADGAGKRPMSTEVQKEAGAIYEAGYVNGQSAWRRVSEADAKDRKLKLSAIEAKS